MHGGLILLLALGVILIVLGGVIVKLTTIAELAIAGCVFFIGGAVMTVFAIVAIAWPEVVSSVPY